MKTVRLFQVVYGKMLLLLVVLCMCSGVQAQVPQRADSLQEQYQLQPQAYTNALRFVKPVALVVAGTGAWTLTYVFVDEPLQQFTQTNTTAVADFAASVVEPLGRQKYMASVSGAVLVSGWLLKDRKLQQFGTLALGSTLTNAVVTGALKNAMRRHRPSATTENNQFDGITKKSHHSSLPSSHTSTAFAFATSLATVYQHHKVVPPVAYGVATLVGLSRIYDNAHWATDVLAGAAVGYLSAKGIGLLYQYAEKRLDDRRQKLYIVPMLEPNTAGLCAALAF
ncbi:phosphatase PAP2 family protein [Pontibacter qinzhouensis]|nr:phosphatase PAP2 family protein [Pontibacter qinzhouensis]